MHSGRGRVGMGQYWFEKTVEYKYVLETIPRIKPLAGALEKFFGDAIEGSNGTYKLIEFKRTAGHRRFENKKFKRLRSETGYLDLKQQARTAVGIADGEVKGHYLVYGSDPNPASPESENSLFPELRLEQCDYWNWGSVMDCSPENMPAFSSKQRFHDYLLFLLKCRSGSGSAGGLVEIMVDKLVRHVSLQQYISWQPSPELRGALLSSADSEYSFDDDPRPDAEARLHEHSPPEDEPSGPTI